MISHQDYYTAPTQTIFDDIKQAAIELWKTYDNRFGYVTEKVDRIKDLQNVTDNWAYMVSMFDHINQSKLIARLELQESKDLVTKLVYSND